MRDGVAELIRVNPKLEKIFIVTEKIVGARRPRDPGDGADKWHRHFWRQLPRRSGFLERVRIGGALGGDSPDEVLLKGSIAIFSNSGSFTTTIATIFAWPAGARRR